MDIKEIFVLICLWFIKIYNNVIDCFKSKKVKEEVKIIEKIVEVEKPLEVYGEKKNPPDESGGRMGSPAGFEPASGARSF